MAALTIQCSVALCKYLLHFVIKLSHFLITPLALCNKLENYGADWCSLEHVGAVGATCCRLVHVSCNSVYIGAVW